MSVQSKSSGWPWVTAGTGLGLLYSLLDSYLDGEITALPSAPLQLLQWAHTVMNHVLPVVTGALFGMFAHYLQMRKQVAEMERSRAEGLLNNLHKLERDQAVWVVSASLLHDLKTPLHALGLLLDELAEIQTVHPAESAELLARARAQSERLAEQLEHLRTLPHSQKPVLPRLDVLELVERIVEPHRPILARQGLALRVQGEPGSAPVQPEYLRIVLDNLIRNAESALNDHPGEHIDISVHAADRQMVIVVQDDGPGPADEVRDHLFSPLHTTKSDGLGLGLSVSRALLRSIGGDLRFEPSAIGARFVLHLSTVHEARTA